ncbi:acid protease [Calocera cornea HHB12733]|uniref:Acid protease n=1 Tax=Calocera cornea HHB12733 TaxID=1353952 RepID=A0A165G7Y0_9BASI|nr:acid protease [Calocera cornea HHB12733]
MHAPLPLTLLLALAAAAAALPAERDAAPDPAPTPISVPLQRRQQPRDLAWIARQRDIMYQKYGKPDAAHGPYTFDERRSLAKRQNAISLVNSQADSSYLGTIQIGTPAQTFTISLDTGSSDLWVVSSTCGASCDTTTTFNEQASSTFQRASDTTPVDLQYGSGEASGPVVRDTVTFAGYSVDPQIFIDVTSLGSGLTSDTSVSGLIGLGWPALSASESTPFVNALVNANKLPSPEMAFFLSRYVDDPNAQSTEPGGYFTLGGTNTSLYTGNIEFHNIQQIQGQNAYWTLGMNSLKVNGASLALGTQDSAIIDTGTSLMGGPQALVDSIFASIPGSAPGTDQLEGLYTYPCSPTVTISVNFGGQDWQISSDDFQIGQTSRTTCVGALMAVDLGQGAPSWILGDTFLKNVYAVFNYSPAQVGFAQLSSTAIDMNPEGEQGASPSGAVATATNSISVIGTPVGQPSRTSAGGLPWFTSSGGSGSGSGQSSGAASNSPAALLGLGSAVLCVLAGAALL